MYRTIDRVYSLNTDELREAILAYLKDKDIPAPSNIEDVDLTLSNSFASVKWTESGDI